MSIISGIKEFLKTYPDLELDANVNTDHLKSSSKVEYSIDALPGEKVIETYLDNSSYRSFPFALMANKSTYLESERIENNAFYEELSLWLDEQTNLGNLPTLGNKQHAEKIEAVSCGYLSSEGETTETGFYRIECRLEYSQGV